MILEIYFLIVTRDSKSATTSHPFSPHLPGRPSNEFVNDGGTPLNYVYESLW